MSFGFVLAEGTVAVVVGVGVAGVVVVEVVVVEVDVDEPLRGEETRRPSGQSNP